MTTIKKNKKKKNIPWKRSRKTTALIYQIRAVLKKEGYDEELGITPLATQLSIIVRRGNDFFNVRMDKKTLELQEVFQLNYVAKRDVVSRVFRHKL